MAGEKHIPLTKFGVGWWDCSCYNGDYFACSTRAAGPDFPMATSLTDPGWKFGSYHPNITQFAFCDGSVRTVQSNLNPVTLGLLAHRSDGQVLPEY